MNIVQTIRKTTRNYRDHGLGITVSKASRRLISFAYERRIYRIYRIHLDNHPVMQHDDKGFTFRLVQPEEHELVKQIEAMEEWIEGKVAEKLQSGSICLIAKKDDRMAGFNLVSFGSVFMPVVQMKRTFRPSEAWSEQITVSRNFRGKGLATLLRYHIFDELKNRGIKRFYGGTLLSNTPNRKLSRKVGFNGIADICYKKSIAERTWTFTRVNG
ncbi:MAG: GNAT family N-acetyltransferase [Deltaproteobacteria bacterium]|nr:GNAT family N-acetyltransferase [Deltaproteobacteria bacterium]